MQWNDHSKLRDSHAFMGASKYQWLRYDEDKLLQVYMNQLAVARGTELHAFAAKCIELGQKLPRSNKTLNSYVNDAIGYKMRPEEVLFYSRNCFGTADSISFRNNFLRIHDLKTGVTPAHMEQLFIYAALFCLEYHIKPGEIQIELRIYQNDDVIIANPDVTDIAPIMDKIIVFDKALSKLQQQED